jgi:ABC-type dipeptide/oligopeptide/nickel transport system permease subunit
MLILVFAVAWRLVPPSGYGTAAQIILPAFTLAAYYVAVAARLTRSGMLEVMAQDYIRTARAKGLSEWLTVFRHALRNAFIPILTILGIQIGELLAGSVVTETVFAWPGVGTLVLDAILRRDYPLVQAVIVVLAVIYAVVNLAGGPPLCVGRSPGALPVTGPSSRVVRAFARNPVAMIGLVLLAATGAVAAFAPVVAPDSYDDQDVRARLKPPLWRSPAGRVYALGTDPLGRDVWSRIVYGASRHDVRRGGGAAARRRRRRGARPPRRLRRTVGRPLIMRAADIQLAFPSLLLAIGLIAALGTNLLTLLGVLALRSWAIHARTVRGSSCSSASRSRCSPRARSAPGRPARVQGDSAQCPRSADRREHGASSGADPARIDAVVPRTRHPAAAPELGQHA